jgi:hypothetical protein
MKVKKLAFSLALCFAAAAVSLAQSPQMGTWKLNEAKSKIPAGYQKNTTVIYAMDGDNVKVTTDGTDATGKPMQTSWTGKFDGKDYPLTGDPSSNSRSYIKVDDRTLTLTNKKDGKAVLTGRVVVSADGKTRTLKSTGTNAAGKTITSTAVYDKQ